MYKPSLDGVRAFCIFFTICNHINGAGAPPFIVGGVGVDVFFALSGFLITTLLIAEETSKSRIDLGSFYIRRFFRIVPLYYLTIILYAASTYVAERRGIGSKGLESFAHSFPWLLSFNMEYEPVTATGGVFGHAWTLGIEEKFYLAWPLFVYVFTLQRRPQAVVLAALVTVGVLWSLSGFDEQVLRGYAGLSFGTMMAIIVQRHRRLRTTLAQRNLALPALLGMAAGYLIILETHHVGGYLTVSFAGALFVASLWHNERQPLARWLALRPLAFAGTLTYAIYLTHVVVANAIVIAFRRLGIPENFYLLFAAVYLASFVFALALHRLIERPLMRYGKRLVSRRSPARVASIT